MRLAEDLDSEAVRYQGNWIPHKLRPATADDVFFVGDSAGHCLPLTAEGIRTAFYFGIACGRELRAVIDGRSDRATALRRYSDFSAAHEWKFEWMLRTQKAVPRMRAAGARCSASGDGARVVRALVVRPLLADRGPVVRQAHRSTGARTGQYLTIRYVPASRSRDPQDPRGRNRLLLEPEDSHPVDHDRKRELAGDRRGGDRPGADRRHGCQRTEDVGRPQDAAEQVIPAHVQRA